MTLLPLGLNNFFLMPRPKAQPSIGAEPNFREALGLVPVGPMPIQSGPRPGRDWPRPERIGPKPELSLPQVV